MSLFQREKSESRGIPILAILLGIGWAAILGALWFFKPVEGELAGNLWLFLGRFHALVVHIPIGLLLIVPILEFFSRWPGKSHLRDSVPLILWLVVLGAVAATIAGYLLMTGEANEGELMTRHLWSGLLFGFLALVTLVLRSQKRGFLYLGSLGLSIVVLSLAGHYGGALVHGPTYLAKHAPEFLKPALMAGLGPAPTAPAPIPAAHGDAPATGDQEIPLIDRVVFTDFVLPIMEAKCTECHNETKTKGKLRLDTHEWIMAGAEGSDYPNVEPGKSDESELVVRVELPADHDDVMPPDGKDPLTPAEIKVIRWWIDHGAGNEDTVAALNADDDMMGALLAVAADLKGDKEAAAAIAGSGGAPVSEWDTLSPEVKKERLDAVMAAADHFHFSVMPISAEDDRLKVNVVNASKEFGDEQLATLDPVAERIIWLDLGRSQVTDEGMKSIARMRNLERLHLENTKVTDAGVALLGNLAKLEYLNLYGTDVTSAIFEPLANARNLRKLYLWQTKVDSSAAKAFQRSMSLEVNLGTELIDPPVAVAEEPIKAEPKKEEPKKAEEPKKEEAKPAPAPAAKKAAAESAPKPATAPVANAADAPKPGAATAAKTGAPTSVPPTPAKKPETENKPAPAPAPAPKPSEATKAGA